MTSPYMALALGPYMALALGNVRWHERQEEIRRDQALLKALQAKLSGKASSSPSLSSGSLATPASTSSNSTKTSPQSAAEKLKPEERARRIKESLCMPLSRSA
ncbi:hypothetical protein CC1G_10210 [Coprinopsis cinerea okayama7|uniref:Uncharacterized protein n=1 Tax=Coprinopsis cinerea (strain Okayama-7 / 130 / ATCC MYA-4618 / FGSC 9003) TaxID=240176 RepID=A8NP87_COPC7|nr:hypothetical protein CC1G_10210 [Coprinopsis cinerea okayama7\|eukprot:XP_001835283.2 hypothetical protein CC1G_10210 [Coprinopsis cinerea okayama7\